MWNRALDMHDEAISKYSRLKERLSSCLRELQYQVEKLEHANDRYIEANVRKERYFPTRYEKLQRVFAARSDVREAFGQADKAYEDLFKAQHNITIFDHALSNMAPEINQKHTSHPYRTEQLPWLARDNWRRTGFWEDFNSEAREAEETLWIHVYRRQLADDRLPATVFQRFGLWEWYLRRHRGQEADSDGKPPLEYTFHPCSNEASSVRDNEEQTHHQGRTDVKGPKPQGQPAEQQGDQVPKPKPRPMEMPRQRPMVHDFMNSAKARAYADAHMHRERQYAAERGRERSKAPRDPAESTRGDRGQSHGASKNGEKRRSHVPPQSHNMPRGNNRERPRSEFFASTEGTGYKFFTYRTYFPGRDSSPGENREQSGFKSGGAWANHTFEKPEQGKANQGRKRDASTDAKDKRKSRPLFQASAMGHIIPIWRDECKWVLANEHHKLTSFPEPPAGLAVCKRIECSAGAAQRAIKGCCKHDLQKAFRSLEDINFKKERLFWHPDRFSKCGDSAADFQAKAQEIFVALNELI